MTYINIIYEIPPACLSSFRSCAAGVFTESISLGVDPTTITLALFTIFTASKVKVSSFTNPEKQCML